MTESTNKNPLVSLIETHQQRMGLSDHELSMALGYEGPAVLDMVKAGSLQLPISKVPVLADTLEADPLDVFRATLWDRRDMLEVIEQIYPPMSLTRAEKSLIAHLRKNRGEGEVHPIVLDGKSIVALVVDAG